MHANFFLHKNLPQFSHFNLMPKFLFLNELLTTANFRDVGKCVFKKNRSSALWFCGLMKAKTNRQRMHLSETVIARCKDIPCWCRWLPPSEKVFPKKRERTVFTLLPQNFGFITAKCQWKKATRHRKRCSHEDRTPVSGLEVVQCRICYVCTGILEKYYFQHFFYQH